MLRGRAHPPFSWAIGPIERCRRGIHHGVPPFDVVIDDGGRVPEHQIIFLEELFPHLRLGGVYLCEDIAAQGNAMVDYVAGLTHNLYEDNKTRPDGTLSRDWSTSQLVQSQV